MARWVVVFRSGRPSRTGNEKIRFEGSNKVWRTQLFISHIIVRLKVIFHRIFRQNALAIYVHMRRRVPVVYAGTSLAANDIPHIRLKVINICFLLKF